MTGYRPPVGDMMLALSALAEIDRLAPSAGADPLTLDLAEAILEEAGRFSSDMLAPLNQPGDRAGSVLENGVVRTPAGFAEAYRAFAAGGWNGLAVDPDLGGQGLPWPLQAAVMEMVQSANLSFGLNPMLTQGAIEALAAHGTREQQALYLSKLISGDWTGTMNLTEPQAGSDLARVRTRAEPRGDHYRLFGQKIFITWGDHDVAENVVHLVLARLPDAPAGVKGISLFAAPKFLVAADGSLGARNDLRAVSLEHKLGIHASPTAVMAFGEDGEGAVATLVGAENRGLEHMFTMMNNARLAVGLQGVAIAERAYQQARDFARERIQGRAIDPEAGPEPVAIIRHPDVRRMLLTMRALTEAARALAYLAYRALDESKRHPTEAGRAVAQRRVDLLTPVVKAWSTDIGVEVASLGVQVHGGMGFIEETGAAQHYRDARILPIYEGTNGIQAADLAFRKVGRDSGAELRAFVAEIRAWLAADGVPAGLATPLDCAVSLLESTTERMAGQAQRQPAATAAGSAAFLKLVGIVAGGYALARTAAAAAQRLGAKTGDRAFLEAKLLTAQFYVDAILPQADGLAVATERTETTLAFPEDAF